MAAQLKDILTDDDLRDLAQGDVYRDRGELSPEHQRLLAMTLPEIAGLILAHRATETAEREELAVYGLTPGAMM